MLTGVTAAFWVVMGSGFSKVTFGFGWNWAKSIPEPIPGEAVCHRKFGFFSTRLK